MISLGPIVLIDNLLLRGLQADRVAVEVERSDSGVAQVLVADIDGGRALELYGAYTFDQVDQILSLSAGKSPVTLVHPKWTGQVLITGTALEDFVEYEDPEPDDLRIGSIYILEV